MGWKKWWRSERRDVGTKGHLEGFYAIAYRWITNRSPDLGSDNRSDVTRARVTEDSHNFSKEEMIRSICLHPPKNASFAPIAPSHLSLHAFPSHSLREYIESPLHKPVRPRTMTHLSASVLRAISRHLGVCRSRRGAFAAQPTAILLRFRIRPIKDKRNPIRARDPRTLSHFFSLRSRIASHLDVSGKIPNKPDVRKRN
jgi:hypothetical protein